VSIERLKIDEMKTHTQLFRAISLLLIFIIMTESTGCYTSRNMSATDINSTNLYLVHYNKNTFIVDSLVIDNNSLTGKILSGDELPGKKLPPDNIYLSADSTVKIQDSILNAPLSSIKSMNHKALSRGRTIGLFAGIFGGAVVVTLVIILVKGATSFYNAMEEAFYCNERYSQ
jgi:hypothetical protein